ncbi:MAG TPA: glycosyltransferase family 39 protein, partial [Pyrinomonadaceae bacterium]
RFPLVLFGTFTTLIIFLLVRELFGRSAALVASCLWAVEPLAIAFDRVAKEDSLVLFFFLLTCFFWVRSQTRAEQSDPKWTRWVWLAGVGFAAVMASKYNPWLLAPIAAYHGTYDRMTRKWAITRPQFLKFFVIMGVAFLVLNPTILIPQTWHEMLKFSSEGRIAHDSYDFMGRLYTNKMTLWFRGVPWTFYLVFLGIKYSVTTLILFVAGLPLIIRRRMGDGRFLLLFWGVFFLLPFSLVGGKFTRYFAIPAPIVLICAAVTFYFGVLWLSQKLKLTGAGAIIFQAVLFAALLAVPFYDSLSVTPHFRLFTNTIGGGMANAGYYFPHDEFYDAGTREVVTAIAKLSPGHGLIACEAPHLLDYYADRIGAPALDTVSLSDPVDVEKLKESDFIVITSGRRYFSNYAYEQTLAEYPADAEVRIDGATFAKIYKLDGERLAAIRAIASE